MADNDLREAATKISAMFKSWKQDEDVEGIYIYIYIYFSHYGGWGS